MVWFCTCREQVNKSKFILVFFFPLKTMLTILASQPNKSLNNIQRVMPFFIPCFCDVFISS